MAVPDYTPPSKAIPLPRGAGDLVVRGLSFEDITTLVQTNLPDITRAVELYRGSLTALYSTASMDGFLGTVLASFPLLAAQAIGAAADDLAAAPKIRRYPMGVQVRALVAIAEMTLEEMGSLTDPSPALADLVRQATGALTRRQKSSPGSSGAFEEPWGPLPQTDLPLSADGP